MIEYIYVYFLTDFLGASEVLEEAAETSIKRRLFSLTGVNRATASFGVIKVISK